MASYFVELPGQLNLKKQAKAIEGEEALGTRFVNARMWVNAKNALSNLAEFEELDEEPVPPLGVPILKKALGAGEAPVWSGQLIVEGTAEPQVFLLRGPPP